MQTRDAPEKVTPLPRPPAPPARDANPWSWPEEANGEKGRRDRFVSIRRAGRSDGVKRPRDLVPRLAVALGIGLLVLMVALNKGFGHGGPKDWVSMMFPVLFLVLFVGSRLRRARRRDDRIADSRED